MDERIELYLEYKRAYYEGKPLISDTEFDVFEETLLVDYPNLRDEFIGWEDSALEKFEHPTSMTSLNKFNVYNDVDNTTTIPEIKNWLDTYKRMTASPKYDGNAINVIYKKGKLWKVLSRGDGIKGRDYTNKMSNLPKTIKSKDDVVEFRGEVLMPLDVFNSKYSNFKNPRNFIAGVLNKKDFIKEHADDLVVEFFDVRINGLIADETHIDNNGLRTKDSFPYTEITNSWDDFATIYNKILKYKATCNYYLDGMVLKLHVDERESFVNGNPKDCVAIKFPPSEASTVINGIEDNVGKTGEITPVLLLRPTLIDGTVVSRASAHNYKYVLENRFFPGAEIIISKSGDIIPQARRVITESTIPFELPYSCPVCNSKLVNDGVNLNCENTECEAQIMKKLSGINHFGVALLGGKTLETLFEAGITKVEDFFTEKFSSDSLITTGFFKQGRQLEKILNEFEQIKEVELHQVIVALQFENAGRTISREYAKKMAGIDYSFASMDRKAIERIDEDRINNFIKLLNNKGIRVKFPEADVKKEGFYKVELTGSVNVSIEGVKTKADYLSLFSNVENVSLNKDTDYLITDDIASGSGKMKKASKLGVKVITYEDFLTLNKMSFI
jgi:DNA ligase (NAD+)